MTQLDWTLDQVGPYRGRVAALFGMSCADVLLRVFAPVALYLNETRDSALYRRLAPPLSEPQVEGV